VHLVGVRDRVVLVDRAAAERVAGLEAKAARADLAIEIRYIPGDQTDVVVDRRLLADRRPQERGDAGRVVASEDLALHGVLAAERIEDVGREELLAHAQLTGVGGI